MFGHGIFGHDAVGRLMAGEGWRPAIAAFIAALAVALAGRAAGRQGVGLAACGLGALAGVLLAGGIGWPPRGIVARLAEVAVAALLLAPLAERRARVGVAAACLLVAAGAWWLGGAPTTRARLLEQTHLILPALAILAVTLWAAGPAQTAARLAASVALYAALHAVGVAPGVAVLALVPAAAMLGAAFGAAGWWLPPSAALAAIAAVALLTHGRLPRGAIGPVDLACLAPTATLWLAQRLAPRLRRLRSGAEVAASLLALLLIVLMAFSAAAFAGLR